MSIEQQFNLYLDEASTLSDERRLGFEKMNEEIIENLRQEAALLLTQAFSLIAKANLEKIISDKEYEEKRIKLSELSLDRVGADVTTQPYYNPTELICFEEKQNYRRVDGFDPKDFEKYQYGRKPKKIIITPGGQIFVQNNENIYIATKADEEWSGKQMHERSLVKPDCMVVFSEGKICTSFHRNIDTYKLNEKSGEWITVYSKKTGESHDAEIKNEKVLYKFDEERRLWSIDLTAPGTLGHYLYTKRPVRSFRVMPDGKLLCGFMGGQVGIVNPDVFRTSENEEKSLELIYDFRPNVGNISDVGYGPDGRIAICFSHGLHMFDRKENGWEHTEISHSPFKSVQFLPNGKILASYDFGNTVMFQEEGGWLGNIIGLGGSIARATADGKIYVVDSEGKFDIYDGD